MVSLLPYPSELPQRVCRHHPSHQMPLLLPRTRILVEVLWGTPVETGDPQEQVSLALGICQDPGGEVVPGTQEGVLCWWGGAWRQKGVVGVTV